MTIHAQSSETSSSNNDISDSNKPNLYLTKPLTSLLTSTNMESNGVPSQSLEKLNPSECLTGNQNGSLPTVPIDSEVNADVSDGMCLNAGRRQNPTTERNSVITRRESQCERGLRYIRQKWIFLIFMAAAFIGFAYVVHITFVPKHQYFIYASLAFAAVISTIAYFLGDFNTSRTVRTVIPQGGVEQNASSSRVNEGTPQTQNQRPQLANEGTPLLREQRQQHFNERTPLLCEQRKPQTPDVDYS